MRSHRTSTGAPPREGGAPATAGGTLSVRPLLVLLHRWIGLGTAVFLAMAGLTGAVLAFHHEIDEWLNPHFYHAPGDGPVLSPGTLAQAVEHANPKLQVWYMEHPAESDHAALLATVPRNDPATGLPYDATQYVFYLDPATGVELGRRQWGACCFEAENLIPFLLEFHYTLVLPGGWGLYLMGVVAIFWTVDCLIALTLTFPRGRPFLAKWRPAWTVKRGNTYRFNLDLHRAGGLWLWLILLPVAISSIAMNLPEQVFKPAVSLVSPAAPSVYHQRSKMPAEELGQTRLAYDDIVELSRPEAARRNLLDRPIGELYYSFQYNFFGVGYGDHDDMLGGAWLFFHGTDGRFLGADIPGQGTLGERFVQWQRPIHGGRVAGLPGRIVIAVTGVAIAALSLTGIYIWWRKLRARRTAGKRGPIQPG